MYKRFLYSLLTFLSPNFDNYISKKFSQSNNLKIVDVGFYKGNFSKSIISKVLKLNPNIRIKLYSFDPNYNINLNKFMNFQKSNKFLWFHHNEALGDEKKKETFTILNAFPSSGSSIENILENSLWYKTRKFMFDPFGRNTSQTSVIDVDVNTLDNLFSEERDVDVLKIDVEGFSYQVLIGAKEFLMINSPILQVEILAKKFEFNKKEIEIIDYLTSIDYKLVSKKKHYTTHIFSDVVCVDYLFENDKVT